LEASLEFGAWSLELRPWHFFRHSSFVIRYFAAWTALLVLAGCATGPATPVSVVWPDPPEQPRVRYLASISKPSDLGFRRSGVSRFANWLIGAEQGNEKFVKPFGIALDEADNLCVTDTGANVVCFFDTAQKRWHRWASVGKFNFASPVAVAKRGTTLFVADS